MANYRIPVLSTFAWQEPVEKIAQAPEVTTKGTRYVVADSPSGAFESIPKNTIVWASAEGVWEKDTPKKGWQVYVKEESSFYVFNGTRWEKVSTDSVESLTINGDINTNKAIKWQLADNQASALTFDVDGKPGLIKLDTTDGSEKVVISGGLVVEGGAVLQGDLTYLKTTNLEITDKNIVLNKGGLETSGNGAGIDIEENSQVAGYIRIASDRAGFDFKAPASEHVVTIKPGSEASTLTVTGTAALDQDLSTTASPTFANITLTSGGTVNAGGITVTAGGVNVTAGNLTLAQEAKITDGSKEVTVTEIKKTFDSRGKYDSALGCLVFDSAALDAAE